MPFDENKLKVYLQKIAEFPTSIPFPSSDYILEEVDKTSHAGAYLKGFVDGSVMGERVLIQIIIDYIDSAS